MMKLSTLNKFLFVLVFTNLAAAFNLNANNYQPNELPETQNLVKANEKYVTLLGTQVNLGESAPNFKVVDKNFIQMLLLNSKLVNFIDLKKITKCYYSRDYNLVSLIALYFHI